MPRSSKKPKKNSLPPQDFQKISPQITKFKQRLRSAQSTPLSQTTASKLTSRWPIYRIIHQCTRYVFDLYQEGKISAELYEWLKVQDYVDAPLMGKWKKRGYEKLCCLNCINGEKVCVCRVPKIELLKKGEESKKCKEKETEREMEMEMEMEEKNVEKEKSVSMRRGDISARVDVECVTCGCRGCASTD
ncbi:BUD31 [Candida oxycetoniae]|uniref:BUD31 n=1 Tax=Candida oxycetoniae TaxID=497107 RepID=A0AAI9SU25_9ASCO|nr:BUD31 [Candida oxycetoniae]KAI3402668.2 BUD31 [Candida oxycetoniae]